MGRRSVLYLQLASSGCVVFIADERISNAVRLSHTNHQATGLERVRKGRFVENEREERSL
jgi:hypothetical protein